MKLFRSGLLNYSNRRLLRKKDESIYEAIKEQPDLVPVSKKLATRSIVFSILSLVCVISAVIILFFGLNSIINPTNFFRDIVIVILGIFILIILFVIFYAKAIYGLMYQLSLNKCRRAKVAIAFVVLPSIIFVGGIIFIAIAAAQNGAAA